MRSGPDLDLLSALGGTRTPNLLIRSRATDVCLMRCCEVIAGHGGAVVWRVRPRLAISGAVDGQLDGQNSRWCSAVCADVGPMAWRPQRPSVGSHGPAALSVGSDRLRACSAMDWRAGIEFEAEMIKPSTQKGAYRPHCCGLSVRRRQLDVRPDLGGFVEGAAGAGSDHAPNC